MVDDELREVEPGEVGELLVAGPQVTLGYWRDPEQTAKAFVVPPGPRPTCTTAPATACAGRGRRGAR